jgi:hypothetical protein
MYDQYSFWPDPEKFTNLSSFDQYISISQGALFEKFIAESANCSAYDGKKNPIVNWQSTLCGFIIHTSTREGCNTQQPPLPLCKSEADKSIQSFEKLKTTVCPSLNHPFITKIYEYASTLKIDDPSGKTCSLLTVDGKSSDAEKSGSRSKLDQLGGTYFIIGMAIGSLVLLIIVIVSAYLCMKRSKKNDTQPFIEHQDADDAEITEVIYEYVPNLFDEIHLSVGDKVLVKIKFDDGWAYGMNMKTKKEGSFPLACVDQPNRKSRDRDQYDDTTINTRASSLYGFPTR